MPHRARLIYAGQLLALATAYIFPGKLGLQMAPVNTFATLVWPPSGIAIAAVLLGGYRLWPAVTVGAFATNLWTGAPPRVHSRTRDQPVCRRGGMRGAPCFRMYRKRSPASWPG